MPNITIGTNHTLQALTSAFQMANALAPDVPIKYKVPFCAMLTIFQWVISIMGHKSNPDGTPAEPSKP